MTKRTSECVLNTDAIVALSKRADILKSFPFLRISAPKLGKSCCNRSSQAKRYYKQVADGLKHTILAMSADQKHTLRQLLRVDQLVLYLQGPRGIDKHIV